MAAAAVLGASCSAGRSSLGTSDGPCYVALPTATAAAGKGAHFDGVRLMKVTSLGRYQLLVRALADAGVNSGRVCLVAFSGSFSTASVSRPSGRPSGHLAVVVLRYPGGQLVSTVLFHHLPTRFGHSHLF